MKKMIFLFLTIGLSLSANSQTVSERLKDLSKKKPQVFLSIAVYSIESCNEADNECIQERAELALEAYSAINRFSSEYDYNELALALSVYKNSSKKYFNESIGEFDYVNYIGAYGDYVTKYKNLDRNELLNIAPGVFVEN